MSSAPTPAAPPAAPNAPPPAAPPGNAPPPANNPPPAAPPAAGDIYRPDGITDDYVGASNQETIDKLFKRVTGLREQMAKGGISPPDSPDNYTMELDGELAPYSDTLKKDPVFKNIREQFHAAGISDAAFKVVVPGVMKFLQEGGHLDAPFDPAKEAASYAASEADPLQQQRITNKAITDNIAFLDGLAAQGEAGLKAQGLSLAAIEAGKQLLDRAGGIQLMDFLRNSGRGKGPATNGQPAPMVTEADYDARLKDPRNDPGDQKFDQRFADETLELAKKLFAGPPRA